MTFSIFEASKITTECVTSIQLLILETWIYRIIAPPSSVSIRLAYEKSDKSSGRKILSSTLSHSTGQFHEYRIKRDIVLLPPCASNHVLLNQFLVRNNRLDAAVGS